jgi:hypothetical protein
MIFAKEPIFEKQFFVFFSLFFFNVFNIFAQQFHRLSQSNNFIGSNDFFCQGHPICSPHGGSLSLLPIPTHLKDEARLQCLGVDLLVLPTKARILCLDSL